MKYLMIFLFVVNFSFATDKQKEVVIAVTTAEASNLIYLEWQSTIDYLNSKVKGYKFKIIPINRDGSINKKIKKKEFDFLLTDPVTFIEAKHQFNLKKLATLHTKKENKKVEYLSSVIFTKSNRADINTIEDLDDKILMAVAPNSFEGLFMAFREIKSRGENPKSLFSQILYTKNATADSVVHNVLSDKSDVGIIPSGLIEEMISTQQIKRSDIKIINQKTHKNYPFISSTKLYPNRVLLKLPHTSEEITRELIITLYSIKENSKVAKAANYLSWATPSDYRDVDKMLKEIEVSLYVTNASEELRKYWPEIIISSIIFIIIMLLLYKIEIQSKELKKISITDPLTKLYNRTKISLVLKAEFLRSKRYGHPFSLIIVNLDNFKNVNEKYSNNIGDKVLIAISTILSENIRIIDRLCRWGGEEFLILCPNTQIDSASLVAQKLRTLIESEEFLGEIQVTASFGVTSYHRDDNSEEEILHKANQALDRAKISGKNRVENEGLMY